MFWTALNVVHTVVPQLERSLLREHVLMVGASVSQQQVGCGRSKHNSIVTVTAGALATVLWGLAKSSACQH